MKKNIPEQVKIAAKGVGSEIVFKHQKDGFEVYIVRTPSKDKDGNTIPTGFPEIILFKDNVARLVGGPDSLDWL